jgi:hypothetical protein
MNGSAMLLGITGIFLGAIGFIISFLMARERKALYLIRSTAMQSDSHPELSIKYQSAKINNVFSVRFIVWNAGGRSISREDIPSPEEGMRLKFPEECRVLFHKVIATGGENSGNVNEIQPNEIGLEFDHLDKGDALLCELLCTTKDNSPLHAEVTGKFKGNALKEGETSGRSVLENVFHGVTAVLIFLISIGLAYFSYQAFTIGMVVMGAVWGLISLFCLWLTVLDIRTNILGIPNKLPDKYKHFLDYGIMP